MPNLCSHPTTGRWPVLPASTLHVAADYFRAAVGENRLGETFCQHQMTRKRMDGCPVGALGRFRTKERVRVTPSFASW